MTATILRFLRVPFFVALAFGCSQNQKSDTFTKKDYQPDRDLGVLFVAVQTTGVFDDYKTFVDCTPLKSPKEIVEAYQSQKEKEDFDLKKFVANNFKLPPPIEKKEVDKKGDMIAHLKNHWTYLTRTARSTEKYTTLIALPEPFIVPGGRFRELFYWDSYFSIIGLLESDEDTLALGMLQNFDFLIQEYGFIPNGNRTYFASRSQPPFFAEMLRIYAKKHGMESILAFLPSLEKEYEFWTAPTTQNDSYGRTIQLDTLVLQRYNGTLMTPRAEGYGKEKKWAATLPKEQRASYHRHLRAVCESGWDFSSRWFADGKHKTTTHCENIIPICLNSLLFGVEKQLSAMYAYKKDAAKANYYKELSNSRKQAINTYLWSAEVGSYLDYNVVDKHPTSILSLAAVYPLFVGAANQEQAASIAAMVEKKLLYPGGVVTTTVNTGEQWDYPNGWAPLQWITVMGLAKYGYKDLAKDIAKRWLRLNKKVFEEEGKMMEKYNVVDTTLLGGGGAYKNQDGFGWTNGVALGLHTFLAQETPITRQPEKN